MVTYTSEKCIHCNSCIRACPIIGANVLEIKEDGTKGIKIDQKECIKCGNCIRACEHGARGIDDDTQEFFADLKNGVQIALIVAPAVKIAFDGYWRHVLQWLRNCGVKHIYDVSFGADICTWAHLRYVKKHPEAKIISQPCAAIVNYCEVHQPALNEHLSPVHSPMMCTATYFKKKHGDKYRIAVLSPCVAKKDEYDQTGLAQYNVTFDKLKAYIEKNQPNIPRDGNSDFEFDGLQGRQGALYPRPGGLKANLKYHAPMLEVINAEGREIYKILDHYLVENAASHPTVFDVLNCQHGCNGGPAVGTEYSIFKMEDIMHEVDEYVMGKFHLGFNTLKSLFRKFDRTLKIEDFCREYHNRETIKYEPTMKEMNQIFDSMGKSTKLDREINCHACGYESCYELATAIGRGIAFKEDCMHFSSYLLFQNSEKVKGMLGDFEVIAAELNNVVSELEVSVNDVRGKTTQINGLNQNCQNDMNEINGDLDELTSLAVRIKEAMTQIDHSVEGYTKMTESVDDIAKQINILAVNANIEAVRAGAVGKGFSVIATEIRKLSQTSQESVNEAEVCNQEINAATENISQIIDYINDAVRILSESVTKMRHAVEETTASGVAIHNDMGDVDKISAHIVELVEKTTSITAE